MSNETKKTKNSDWLDSNLPSYERLKVSAQNVLENLLAQKKIDYLSISGRVKDKKSCLEKVERKGYSSIKDQMTDLSGIRVVVYFESDLDKVGGIIRETFDVDYVNSEDKVDSLDKDKIGYRSVHYVCDLGENRCSLPEFSGLNGMKFEVQVRTVLQHAWAELAHDRGYKFANSLPLKLERKLNLYAGLLEIADAGFDEISNEIDRYKEELERKDDIDQVLIDSISLSSFMKKWGVENDIDVEGADKSNVLLSVLVDELKSVGVVCIKDLREIIPSNYVHLYKSGELSETNIFGMVRDWAILHDHLTLLKNANVNWVISEDDIYNFEKIESKEKGSEIREDFIANECYEEE